MKKIIQYFLNLYAHYKIRIEIEKLNSDLRWFLTRGDSEHVYECLKIKRDLELKLQKK